MFYVLDVACRWVGRYRQWMRAKPSRACVIVACAFMFGATLPFVDMAFRAGAIELLSQGLDKRSARFTYIVGETLFWLAFMAVWFVALLEVRQQLQNWHDKRPKR